ncbi:hypothetical protein FXF51_52765 [Nonomuraea sp. PA05]|uniref:hypothetical protein n=1 Tax=Nonomuraea sp. PA05 TaxID=2604466 RepID=UPI0011D44F44|nr:hypothetical protein [Nonomuraea sp. PA05]TYB51826.1 hypothetical protein FXF51_52765 [Nonomuraea sp. PA05]
MAHLLRHLEEELYVQDGLCVHGGIECPQFRDEELEDGYYTVAIRLEAWDAEPPHPGPGWRPTGQREFTAETGVIRLGVTDDTGQDFLIGPPLFAYGVTAHVGDQDAGRWLLRFWPVRDVFDPIVHLKPRDAAEPRRVPVPVTTAGQWAPMRREALRPPEWAWFLGGDAGSIAGALNPGNASTFRIPDDEVDLRGKGAGGTYRMWRWEWETADGRPHDGNLLAGRIVHLRDPHGSRLLASGVVTMLGMEGRHYVVRDAEPHEAARVLCSEETWSGAEPTRPGAEEAWLG